VATIAPQVDSLTGAVDVLAQLMAPTRQPRLGEVVTAHLQTDVHTGAVAVPAVSLVPAGDGYQVFVVVRGDTAHARAVTVGRRSGTLAEILDGVAVGETVVTEGAYGLEDGSALRITSKVGAGSPLTSRVGRSGGMSTVTP
jgi:multidrug efflux pump subunit AcrA (membrane-fusion protein)